MTHPIQDIEIDDKGVAHFRDAFARYLPTQSVTPSQTAEGLDLCKNSTRHKSADVTDRISPNPDEFLSCDGVTDEKPSTTDGKWCWHGLCACRYGGHSGGHHH